MNASKKEFIAEAEELLQESQNLILEIQDTSSTGINPDSINALFRANAYPERRLRTLRLQGITRLSHALETLMDDVRLGKIAVDNAVIAFLFRNLDILRTLVDAVSMTGRRGRCRLSQGHRGLPEPQKGQVDAGAARGAIDPSIMKVLSEYEEHSSRPT